MVAREERKKKHGGKKGARGGVRHLEKSGTTLWGVRHAKIEKTPETETERSPQTAPTNQTAGGERGGNMCSTSLDHGAKKKARYRYPA